MLLFGLCIIFVIIKAVDMNSEQYLGDLQDDNESFEGKDYLKKYNLVDLIVKPSENIFMAPKTEDFDHPLWTTKFMKNTELIRISPNKIKKSLVTVGIHHGPSYHMELNSVPPYTDLRCSNCHQQKERRNPTFNPWGGKRSIISLKSDTKIRRPVRVPFNSWGGKRQEHHHNLIKLNCYEKMDEKRINDATGIKKPFNSWGGKRSPFTSSQSIFTHKYLIMM